MAPIFVLLCAGFVFDILKLRNQYEQVLQRQANLSAQLIGHSVIAPLKNAQLTQVDELVREVLHGGSIARIEIIRPDASVVTSQSAEGIVPDATHLTVSHVLTADEIGQIVPLGELFVTLNAHENHSNFVEAMYQKALIWLAFLISIAAILFAILSKLSQPLVSLTEVISRIGCEDINDPIPGLGRRDEIGMVALAIDQWRKNEAEVTSLRAQDNEYARRDRQRIGRALASTRDAVLLMDETGLVVFCNDNATEYFRGAYVGELLDAKQWLDTNAARKVTAAINTKSNLQFETKVNPKHESGDLNMYLRCGPIQDENGGFLGTVILATDYTEQARQTKRAKYLSEHDSLTGLANRRLMEETLNEWVHVEEQDTSILLADLDDFKLINDTLGHFVGDSLLQHIAKIFCSRIGDQDLAVRLGGDEFAILAKGKNSEERLVEIARQLIEELSHPQQVDWRTLHTGLSIGISHVEASELSALDGVRRADLALYEAKNSGRGRFNVFHTDLEAVVNRKSLLDAELRNALKNNSISVVYQMQTDLRTKQIIGFETLARWVHPTMGPISPQEFIPIAEESGLIADLTYQVMIQACQTAVEWQEMGFEGRIAVNMSPKLFGAQIDEFVSDCLLITNCPASAIEAEITETVVLSNGSSALQEIEALQRLGVTIALDDFGMGYSSLSYLQKFPVDKIKVDRAFVSKMPESAETRAIVTAITDLGHALNMQVTGEGAETEEHRDCLRACHVDFLQGYVDGKPLPKEQATELLQKSLWQRKVS
ncbi:putative bifunctional diguanylate cyclase/phosphodiesterase [Aestuariibius sp. HNIBRBA575]|uniref:putative bifunctional diguanylate cyclase/phosphodiesterase n=1 Tax=Aestuariibius sp. HNIBRBA575 TaxID=3233343 RepID=UPI0034A59956